MLGPVIATSALGVALLLFATWAESLRRRDASIVDVVWGLAFVVVALTGAVVGDGLLARRWLLAVLITVWGVRLAIHLAWRSRGRGEDRRYQRMRAHHGPRFGWVSLVTVFALQGALVMVVSLPVPLAMTGEEPTSLGPLAALGVAVWALGMVFEAGGDLQLTRFRADPANEGAVMDRGLWAWTRHPNYFGDACVWWGVFLVAAEVPAARWAVVGPVVMTVLLRRVSGVPLLERDLTRRRPGYADYVARTSAFLPRPPRRTDGGAPR